jgi:hypothetical protein
LKVALEECHLENVELEEVSPDFFGLILLGAAKKNR